MSSTAQVETQEPAVSLALEEAIDTIDHVRLRRLVKQCCKSNEPLRKELENILLVHRRDVIPYHTDSFSEDNLGSDEESSQKDEEGNRGEDDTSEYPVLKKRKQIAAAEDKMLPRFAMCMNCEAEFNVTVNQKGDCLWHPGIHDVSKRRCFDANMLQGVKEVDWNSDFWADHDENCHGPIEGFQDDPDMAEGFIWSCCEKLGDEGGCKSTKHKARFNLVQDPSLDGTTVPIVSGRKRNIGGR